MYFALQFLRFKLQVFISVLRPTVNIVGTAVTYHASIQENANGTNLVYDIDVNKQAEELGNIQYNLTNVNPLGEQTDIRQYPH